jgi:nucleoside-diphosphate-sugar epimerase
MKRVLVTGATGFIGRQCLSSLLNRGYEVYACSLHSPGTVRTDVHWLHTDLLDPSDGAEWLSRVRPTHLLHLAWYVIPGKWATSLENFLWVQASLRLLRQFADIGGQRVVMAGSCAEYDWNYGFCTEDTTPTNPGTVYGICKNALRMLLDGYSRQTGLSCGWGRVFNVYGPHEHPARLVPDVIRSLLKGKPARCTHGNQIRDYLHVQDVADGFVALLDSEVTGAVNIASGRPVQLKDMVGCIAELLGRPDLVALNAVRAPLDDPPLLVANVSRLSNEVGWSQRYNLNEGLEDTVYWWRHQDEIQPEERQS